MARSTGTRTRKAPVEKRTEDYQHKGAQRSNNPEAGLFAVSRRDF